MSIRARSIAAGLLPAAQPLLCVTAADQSAAGLAGRFPFCAWWAETTATSINVAFPDTSAAYRTTPLLATQDPTSVAVSGQYTDARYFSLNTYTNGGATYTCGSTDAPSALADYLIAPDGGSLNSSQVSAAPGGRYIVTLARSGAGTPSQNTIPLYECSGCAPAPAQDLLPSTLSLLIPRAYLPHDEISAVVLSDLTLHFADGRDQTLPKRPGRNASPTRSVVTPPEWTFILR